MSTVSLIVTNVRAENLVAIDPQVQHHPQVILQSGGKTFVSKEAPNDRINPTWNDPDPSVFMMDCTPQQPFQELEILVFCRHAITASHCMGRGRVRIEAAQVGTELKVPLTPGVPLSPEDEALRSNKAKLGQVFVTVRRAPGPPQQEEPTASDVENRDLSPEAVTAAPIQHAHAVTFVLPHDQNSQPQLVTHTAAAAVPVTPATTLVAAPTTVTTAAATAAHPVVTAAPPAVTAAPPAVTAAPAPTAHPAVTAAHPASPITSSPKVKAPDNTQFAVELAEPLSLHTITVDGIPPASQNTLAIAVVRCGGDEFRSAEVPLSANSTQLSFTNLDFDTASSPIHVQIQTKQANKWKQLVSGDVYVSKRERRSSTRTKEVAGATIHVTLAVDDEVSLRGSLCGTPVSTTRSVAGANVPPTHGILLDVVSAADLLCREHGQPPNPFVVVAAAHDDGHIDQLAQSNVIRNSVNPHWDQRLTITALDNEIKCLRIVVLDTQGVLSYKVEFLGECTLVLRDIPAVGGGGTITLLPRSDPEFKTADDNVLLRAKRATFGTISLRWIIDEDLHREHAPAVPLAPVHNPVTAHRTFFSATAPRIQTQTWCGGFGSAAPAKGRSGRGSSAQSPLVPGTPCATDLPIDPKPIVKNARHGRPGPADVSAGAVSGHGRCAVLHCTVLSMTNAHVTPPCVPYVRVIQGGVILDNEAAATQIPDTGLALWQFETQFRVPLATVKGTIPVRLEVCDKRTKLLISTAQLDIPIDTPRHATKTVPLIPEASSTRSSRAQRDDEASGELTVLYQVTISHATNSEPSLGPNTSLSLCVLGAQSLAAPWLGQAANINPYVIITVHGPRGRQEFRTSTVAESRSPLWYFLLPDLDVGPTDQVKLTVWHHDVYEFDDIVGEAQVPVDTMIKSPHVMEVPLLPPAELKASLANVGTISFEWSLSTRRLGPLEPRVVEVGVLEAKDLIDSVSSTACVHIFAEDQATPSAVATTALVSTAEPRWDEMFHVHLEGHQSRLRLAVTDQPDPSGQFLGEVIIRLESLTAAADRVEVLTLPLRPRQDLLHHKQDVELLNRSQRGFGMIKLSLRILNVRGYEMRRRELMKAQGKSYQLAIQVADTIDVTQPGSYVVSVAVAGMTRESPPEEGPHPRFRKSFAFTLYDDVEMMTVTLTRLSDDDSGADERVGEVTLPAMRPRDVNSEPVAQWLELRSNDIPEQGRFAKLLVRWRTFSTDSASVTLRNDTTMRTVINRGQAPIYPSDGLDSGYDNSRLSTAKPMASPVLTGTSPASRRAGAINVNVGVYYPPAAKLVRFVGTGVSTVQDVISFCRREFQIPHHRPLTLLHGENPIPLDSQIAAFAAGTLLLQKGAEPQKETIHYASNPMLSTIQVSHNTNATVDSANDSGLLRSARSVSLAPRGDGGVDNAAVAQRVHNQNAPVVSCFIVLQSARQLSDREVGAVIDIVTQHRVNGFCRFRPDSSGVECFVQGPPLVVGPMLQQVVQSRELHDLHAVWRLEEARGYIPMLQAGFRVAKRREDAPRMFELCGLGFNGNSTECWFYKADYDPNVPNVRFIDERDE